MDVIEDTGFFDDLYSDSTEPESVEEDMEDEDEEGSADEDEEATADSADVARAEKKKGPPAETPAFSEPLVSEQKPQDKIELTKDHVEDYRTIKEALGGFSDDPDKVDTLALSLANVIEKRVSAVRAETQQTADGVFYSTPEGEQVKMIMDRYKGVGMTRDLALQLHRDTQQYQKVSSPGRGKSGEQMSEGKKLSPRDKKILKAIGCSPKQYIADLKEMKKGKYISVSENGTVETIVDIPMKPKERK